jgi:protein involved in polysaccharide export with SLBB domain
LFEARNKILTIICNNREIISWPIRMSIPHWLFLFIALSFAVVCRAESGAETPLNQQENVMDGAAAVDDAKASAQAAALSKLEAAARDRKSDPRNLQSLVISPLSAERPTWNPDQFQMFVESASGQRLQHFGHELFRQPPSTFAPLLDTPVPADYTVGPGDELLVRLTGAIELDTRVTVDRNGLIRLSRIGTIPVTGVRVAELEGYLRDKIARLYKNFTLSVSLGQLRSMQIYVMGQARRPGAYTVSSLSTLVSAIFASGGPSANGSLRQIRLMRHDRPLVEIDLYALISQGDKTNDVKLQPGDVIVIPPAGPRVALLGAYNRPAIYELRKDAESIEQVLAYGGGMPVTALPQTAMLERISTEQGGRRGMEEISLGRDRSRYLLMNGDMLTLLPIRMEIGNAVTLRGHVATPTRFPYRAEMRVRDVVPDISALQSADYFQGKNALVSFQHGYLKPAAEVDPRNEMLVEGEDKPDPLSRSRLNAQSDAMPGTKPGTKPDAKQEIERLQVTPVNWDYATIDRINPRTLKPELISFNLQKAILESDPSHNLALQPGDVITIYSTQDTGVPGAKDTHLVKLEGELVVPGIYQARTGETLRELVVRLGGMTPEAYLYGARFYRESVKLEQQKRWEENLNQLAAEVERVGSRKVQDSTDSSGASAAAVTTESQRRLVERLRLIKPEGQIALELPLGGNKVADLPDIVLENGDRFHVPRKPPFVTVMGQVYNPGSFLYRADGRIDDYMKLAGGSTRQANAKDIHVVHANGTVSSSRQEGWLGGGISGSALQPGDTIFVPEELDRYSWRKDLKDWTSVLYQFGLGAAALKSLTD